MKILAILAIALGSFALKAETARITRLKNNTNAVIKPQAPRRNYDAELIHQMLESNKRLMALFERRSGVPVIWEQGAKILTGKVIRGTLLNSIVSTNLASPILVLARPGQGLPPKTKFSCQGVTQNKRVLTLCSKMVTQEKEIPITAQVLNLDGTSGLLGKFDDGKEDLIMGAVASDFAQGMLSVAQTKIASPFGAIREDSVKNQILEGGIQSGRTTSDILLEEMKTKEPVVTVNAGEEVLVYFMEAVNEK
ncbi:MAG: hypothetical protein HYV97_03590 [Bdellovibrio sp.]|nr:hypothetical protein [Bdellovibrio sp.]